MFWLSYISAVGRSYVLSESTIKYPVAEYLQGCKVENVELEYAHPMLSYKRIDLFFKNSKNINTAFEFKYIKGGSTRTQNEKQRIFNDLMRLFLFQQGGHDAFFLICGNQYDFIVDFQRIIHGNKFITPKTMLEEKAPEQPEGFYTTWFSFDEKKPTKEIIINQGVSDYKEIYNQFLTDYNGSFKDKTGNTLTLPEKIYTRLVFLSEKIGPVSNKDKNDIFNPTKIGVWKISG